MTEADVDAAVAAAAAALRQEDPGILRAAYHDLVRHISRDLRVPPLAAAAFDRMRMLAGDPQKFGTQTVEREGRLQLWTVDSATTDSERAKWGVPPLARLQARVAAGEPPLG